MIKVRVPATSANIGPGFDALGVALSLYARVGFEETESGLVITGTPERYAGPDNLVYAAYRAAMERMGLEVKGVNINIESAIPVSRGLGSSAAMYAAGALGASALHGNALSRAELLEVTNALEGHPDNLAPALYGGFTAAMMHEGKPYVSRCATAARLRFLAFVPEFETSTHEARAALPKLVAHADAVYTLSHALALVNALRDGDAAAIGRAVSDRLHEPFRKKLIPGFDELKHAVTEAGAVAFFISGSGSTCMSIYTDEDFPLRAKKAASALPGGWRTLPLSIDTDGAVVL